MSIKGFSGSRNLIIYILIGIFLYTSVNVVEILKRAHFEAKLGRRRYGIWISGGFAAAICIIAILLRIIAIVKRIKFAFTSDENAEEVTAQLRKQPLIMIPQLPARYVATPNTFLLFRGWDYLLSEKGEKGKRIRNFDPFFPFPPFSDYLLSKKGERVKISDPFFPFPRVGNPSP